MATNTAVKLQEQGGPKHSSIKDLKKSWLAFFVFRVCRWCINPWSSLYKNERCRGQPCDRQGEVRIFRNKFLLMTKKNATPHGWVFYKQSKVNFSEHCLWSRWFPVVFYPGIPPFLHNTLHSLCSSRCICSFQEFRTCFGTYWIVTTLNLLMMKSEHSHQRPSLAAFCSAVCDRDMFRLNTSSLKTLTSPLLILHAEDDNIVPHHMGLKVLSILFHFLLRVASSSFRTSFPSPAVPDITSGQEKNWDRCPGWNDLLQREAWILPQRHLLGP